MNISVKVGVILFLSLTAQNSLAQIFSARHLISPTTSKILMKAFYHVHCALEWYSPVS